MQHDRLLMLRGVQCYMSWVRNRLDDVKQDVKHERMEGKPDRPPLTATAPVQDPRTMVG